MAYEIGSLVNGLNPEETILFFGAGASIPSGAPSVSAICDHLSDVFDIKNNSFSLRELSSIVEQRESRAKLIFALRRLFQNIKPTGGLRNLPMYSWRSIFTTNYDKLIEEAYARKREIINVYSSNFDFKIHSNPKAPKLFKIHGTIEKDVVDGCLSRIIITDIDYDHTEEYREQLFDRLKADMSEGHLIVIGYSLSDPDIKSIIDRAAKIKSTRGGTSRMSLIMYSRDEARASLLENRGLNVYFGGVDDFFSELSKRQLEKKRYTCTSDVIENIPALTPLVIDVVHSLQKKCDISAMFNGGPAAYSDIRAGFTFQRTMTKKAEAFLQEVETMVVSVLGASGVGKTTCARQIILSFVGKNAFQCWEHVGDYALQVKEWCEAAEKLRSKNKIGILFIDDAHNHLHEVNDILEWMAANKNFSLKLILCSSKNFWYPRVKAPVMFKFGMEIIVSKLDELEISNLLDLVDSNQEIARLVENNFSGFSRHERQRRLIERCESDMFVCLRNIFATEKFDDIILKEYAALPSNTQEVYRLVAAMESSGIRVHRQLVIRLLNINSAYVQNVLQDLADIVAEYSIDAREGIYGWKCRHSVIAKIIRDYKFSDIDALVNLFDRVIENLLPTYDIEVRSIVDLCNVETGIQQIPSKSIQNTLLRKMISSAPAARVPRHRLIRNLIEMGELEKTETEIRIFEKDFSLDGPVARYKINLLKERAETADGIMHEDRVVILRRAQALAKSYIRKFSNNKNILYAYCDVAISYYKYEKDTGMYDEAIELMRKSEIILGDPDLTKSISRYERIMMQLLGI